VMYSRGRRRLVARSYIDNLTHDPSFPAPLIVYPHDGRMIRVRLWLPGPVEAWMERNIRGWRDLPEAPRPPGSRD
jgi:hypothetical protein